MRSWAGTIEDSTSSAEPHTSIGPLREETARVRELVQSCREDNVDLRRFRERMHSARQLVTERRFDEALAYLRQLKLELLDQVVLAEARPSVLPGVIENPPVGEVPRENPRPPVNHAPSWKVKIPKR
jgi:hypothetical protein